MKLYFRLKFSLKQRRKFQNGLRYWNISPTWNADLFCSYRGSWDLVLDWYSRSCFGTCKWVEYRQWTDAILCNYCHHCNVITSLFRITVDLRPFSAWLLSSITFLRYSRTSSVSNSFARWDTSKYVHFSVLHWYRFY